MTENDTAIWCCDSRQRSDDLPRWWGIQKRCESCGCCYSTAVEMTKAEAEAEAKTLGLCVECE